MRTTTRSGVRPLGASDVADFLALTDRDPTVNVFAAHRARQTRLEPRLLGGEVWGRFVEGELVSACHVGANLVPVQAGPEDAAYFAERLLRRGRTVSTVVGPAPAVRALWADLGDAWGPPRETRWTQPHLVADAPPLIDSDPLVRVSRPDDFAALYPACVSMYTEELGVSPEANNGAKLYRARVAQLIAKGHAFAHIEGDSVVFKAELGAVTPHAAHLQSVWVEPRLRGQGLAAGGVAAVCAQTLEDVAPVVSLYVNEHNEPARRSYERAGFVTTGMFATILF